MKKTPFIILMLLFGALVLGSCESEDVVLIKESSVVENSLIKNKRLAFDSIDDFLDLMNKLSNKNAKELSEWEKALGFISLRTYTDNHNLEIPENVSSIAIFLNKDYEYQIGNKIYYINGETEYIIDNEDEELLEIVKKEIENGKVMVHDNLETSLITKNLVSSNNNNEKYVNAPYQREFTDHGVRFKFVDEIYMYTYASTTVLQVRMKFEYRGSRGWHPANGEWVYKRMTNVSITGSQHYGWFSFSKPLMSTSPVIPQLPTPNGGSKSNLVYTVFLSKACIWDLRVNASFLSVVYPQNNANIGSVHSYNVPSASWYFQGQNFCNL